MLKLAYVLLCMAGMTGFFYLCRFLIYGVSTQFGYGVGVGASLFVVMFWLAERLGALRVVEPSKGEWIPFDRQKRRPNSDF
ncbi:hypothetical protein DXM27_05100 [Rhizobium rhizogenes]|uniref:Uncharacterized protein n=1 Tax=Rhizobium rhizogenes TaxID=359 RepID=A0AA88JSL4_RHIRH|nr:hypothetical protein [Rhizobium rhizogenes]KAA3504592.1 hypothetical protein DXM27_05100 [Rhizobium rhizogenes]